MNITKSTLASATVLCASTLAACSGGGSDSPQTAPFTLRVTDAPIDPTSIDRVCVQFSGITVHYAGQEETYLAYAPLPSQVSATTHCLTGAWNGQGPPPPVRLDALGGALTVALAESLQIPVGRITWIRLHFIPGGAYVVETTGGQQELRCPSCELTDNNDRRGFKLNRTIEVTSAGIAVTVDIDLAKSLHRDGNGVVLRPTARMELDGTVGTIVGTVDSALITTLGGTPYSGGTVETGCAAYVYAGNDVTPADHYDGSPVLVTARVRYDITSGSYRFAVGALPDDDVGAEPYTVALTCDSDDPLIDEDGATVAFTAAQNVGVTAGQAVEVAFPPAP
jgi:hypothetical protein